MNSEHINAQHQTKRGNLPLFLFIRSVQLVARNHESRTEVESFVQQVARYTRNHESRTEVESFVQQVARYARNHEYPKRVE